MGRHPTHFATKQVSNFGPPAVHADQLRTTKLHCPLCTLSWTKLTDYNRHLATHNDAKPYPCKHKGCQKSFSQKTALVTHWNTHTGARPHRCRHPGCNSAFGDPSSRTRHEKETHDPANGYKCRECGNVSKRREQFRRHYKDCFHKDPLEEQIVDAREHCATAYAERVAKGEPLEEVVAPPPPKRKRRGAVATISPLSPPEEYDEDDFMANRQTPPKYEPSYTGDFSGDSTITSSPNFYRASEEPTGGSPYGDAFEPAYTPLPASKYYSQPPPQYTPHDPTSPGHRFEHSLNLARMNSPAYDIHDMNDRMIGNSYSHGRLPTADSSFSELHSSPGHTGNYSISTPHISSSPHLNHSPHTTASTPPLLMPVATRQAILFDHIHDSPPLSYPQTGYGGVDSVDRIPRGVDSGHPQVQSRWYLHQHRHQPYARDHRGGPSASTHVGMYPGSPNLPVVDNSYGGRDSDPDSDSILPLSLAAARVVKPMVEPYESNVPF